MQALDDVMKPVKRERLAQLMERVEAQLRRRSPQTLTIQNTEGLFRVAYEDILYCYSDRRQVTVVTQGREYPFYAKLDDVAQTCPYVCVLRGGHVRYDGATADLVGEARGRTWLTPPLAAPPAQGVVVNAASSPEGTRYRLVADAPPAGSQLVESALEDGYMALASTSR